MKTITNLPELASRLTGRRYFLTAQFNSAAETLLGVPAREVTAVRKLLLLDTADTDAHVVAFSNLLIAQWQIAKYAGLDVASILTAAMPANTFMGDRFDLGMAGQADPQVLYKPAAFPFPCVFERTSEADGIISFRSKDVPGTMFDAEVYGDDGRYLVRWPAALGVVGDFVDGANHTPTDQIIISPTHYPFSPCFEAVKTDGAVSAIVAMAGTEQAFGLLPHDSEKLAVLAASLVLATY